MGNLQKAKDLIGNAYEIRGSKAKFLNMNALPLRDAIRSIKEDRTLAPEYKAELIAEFKENQTKIFMDKVSLRKQEYQHHLNEAKAIAEKTIEESVIYPSDASKLKFSRDFSDLKFKLALQDGKGAMAEIKKFTDNVKDAEYATILLDNFHEIAGKFSGTSNQEGFKSELTRLYKQFKTDFTPEEVMEAESIIETVDGAINNRLFTLVMPGDNPTANPEYNIISEVFSRDAVRFYQEPEGYYESKGDDVQAPVFAGVKEQVEEKKQEPTDPDTLRYQAFMKQVDELKAKLQPNNGEI